MCSKIILISPFHFEILKTLMMRGLWCWLKANPVLHWSTLLTVVTVTCTRSGKGNTKQGRPTSKTPAGLRSRCPWMLIDWELQVLCVAQAGSGWLRVAPTLSESHRQQPQSLTTYIWLIVHRQNFPESPYSPSLPLSLPLSLPGRLNTKYTSWAHISQTLKQWISSNEWRSS